jgi:hypothetical protein
LSKSSNVERGQTNYLYVQVTNMGPRDARNVVVDGRITPYVGLQFVYPGDWNSIDSTHVSPTPVTSTFASIPAGATAMAKFTISSAQVEDLWGWVSSHPWHPCLLTRVTSDNDYAFASAVLTGGNLVVRRNNLAQRNLSVIDVLSGAAVAWPFIAGHPLNLERQMQLAIDRSKLPAGMPLLLALDEDHGAFPRVDLDLPKPERAPRDGECGSGMVLLERTRVTIESNCCRGMVTLEKGSRFDCLPERRLGAVDVQGGDVILRDDRRFVEIRDALTIVTLDKQPGGIYPVALHTRIPADASTGRYMISASQRRAGGETVGGAAVAYIVS